MTLQDVYNTADNERLTEVGRIIVFWTVKSYGGQVRNDVLANAGEHALPVRYYVYVVEQGKQSSTRRVYGAYDCTATVREILK